MNSEPTIAHRLDAVRQRVERACVRSGRDHKSVCLVGVTKKFGIETIKEVVTCGLSDLGENRPQELQEKAERLPGVGAGGRVTWHMVGHLQRNKVGLIVRHADTFHALDSKRLAEALQTQLEQSDRTLDCFIQVNVSGEESKFGVEPDLLPELGADLADLDRIRLVGLMTLASQTSAPEQVRPQFSHLRRLAESSRYLFEGGRPLLSMGMSGDFEVAIEEGATHVRLGTAIFGPRPTT